MKFNFTRQHIGTLAVVILIAIFGRDIVTNAIGFTAGGLGV